MTQARAESWTMDPEKPPAQETVKSKMARPRSTVSQKGNQARNKQLKEIWSKAIQSHQETFSYTKKIP